jgi:glutaminyl-peptide cyclotransferase
MKRWSATRFRPVADQDPIEAKRTLPVPGANDGASGVAVLLELARVLGGRRPAKSVLFGFFDGEDLGEYYYGSRLYSRHINCPALSPWRPKQAILLDMVGKKGLCCTQEIHSQRYAPQLWEAVQAAAQRCGLEHHFSGAKRAINDDHVFLNEAGIPSILLIDYAFPQWHTTGDSIEQCDAASLKIIGDVVLDHLFAAPVPKLI